MAFLNSGDIMDLWDMMQATKRYHEAHNAYISSTCNQAPSISCGSPTIEYYPMVWKCRYKPDVYTKLGVLEAAIGTAVAPMALLSCGKTLYMSNEAGSPEIGESVINSTLSCLGAVALKPIGIPATILGVIYTLLDAIECGFERA